MEIIQYPQKNFNKKIADKILVLEHIALPQDTEDEVFTTVPNTYLTSFILTENNTAICHVGIHLTSQRRRISGLWTK